MASLCEEESHLLADSKYRSYVANTEKALKGFESTSEWADLISTLAKLNKVLLSHTKYPVVPRRIIISKRLAQCMHPALPSGVHLKALETYDIIFRSMGTNRLSQELFIYSAGLFPVFVSAAMNVRSALLTIYETHFVPLGTRLRPGLNGFLSGILPGLEEGSDHLERTSQLLLRVAEGVGQPEFFGSLWECIAGNGSVRLPAITHITSCYNKKLSTEDQLHILGTNLDIMVRGVCSSLVDGGVLVQRAALDLVLAALPLHNTRLLLRHDVVRIVAAAVLTLLRRDTSLNRRLYSWLLGLEVNTSHLPSLHPVVQRLSSTASDASDGHDGAANNYFVAFSRQLLVEGIVCCFKDSEGSLPPDLRPYRLVVSLLDKQEVGPHLLDDILLDMLRCLYHSCEALKASEDQQTGSKAFISKRPSQPNQSGKAGDPSAVSTEANNKALVELTKSAGLVFSALQPSYPWLRLLTLLSQACRDKVRVDLGLKKNSVPDYKLVEVKSVGSGRPTFLEVCTLMNHLLGSLPLDTQQQTESARIMEVLSVLTGLITDHLDILSCGELAVGVKLCHGLLQKLIPSVTLPRQDSGASCNGNNYLSRPDSRTSVATFNSFQCRNSFTGNYYGSYNVNSAIASFPITDPMIEESGVLSSNASSAEDLCKGIVQIGIEANETPSSLPSESSSNVLGEDMIEILPEDGPLTETCEENDSMSSRVDMSDDLLDSMPISQTSEQLQNSLSTLRLNNKGGPDSFCNSINNANSLANADSDPMNFTNAGLDDDHISASCSPKLFVLASLYNYVTEFEKFFFKFVQKRIILDSLSLGEFQQCLFVSPSDNRAGELKTLLKECLICALYGEHENATDSLACFSSAGDAGSQKRFFTTESESVKHSPTQLRSLVILNDNFESDMETFELSCAILVDLSSIPTTSGKPYHFLSSVSYLDSPRPCQPSFSSQPNVCSTTNLSPPTEHPLEPSSSANTPSQSTTPISTSRGSLPSLPGWLVALVACSCAGDGSVTLQHAALATLVELLTLGQSELSVWRDGGGALAPNPATGEDGVVTINIIPRVHPTHMHLFMHHTTLYQQMAQMLWQQLDLTRCGSQVHSVELLLRLHAITAAPAQQSSNGWSSCRPSLVERELLAELSRPVVATAAKERHLPGEGWSWSHGGLVSQYSNAALQRWLTMWQLSRHTVAAVATHSQPLGLDRCLFLMLERVRGGGGCERSLAHRWLCHSLSSGDAGRLLDPLLRLLLHPHTRRISVQHVTVRRLHGLDHEDVMVLGSRVAPDDASDNTHSNNNNVYDGSSDSLIYAISSVGGEVMYHVSKEAGGSKEHRESGTLPAKKFLSSAAKQLLALTSMSKDKFVTENVDLPDYEVPYMGESGTGQQQISVLVNPFSQHPWLELEDMTKIDRNPSNQSSSSMGSPPKEESCGLPLDDLTQEKCASMSQPKNCDADEELSNRNIAESIMKEILERVIERCAPLPPLSDPDSSSSADTSVRDSNRVQSSHGKSDLKPPDMTLHPLHSHMLLYTQLVDSGQCLYGLGLLKNILEAQPKLSLLSLASTGISSLQPPSGLMVLIARHKRCVFGQGFDGGNVSEMVGQYRSTMYLQVVITVCLYYLRSYYPRLPHLRLKNEHLSDNTEVQVVAIEVLVLVFSNLSSLVADSPRGLAPYILDLLNKCKVQKCVLHCLLATVHAMRLPGNTITSKKNRAVETKTFTQELLDYNNRGSDGLSLVSQETFLSNAMDLILALIKLEDALAVTKTDSLPREETDSLKSSSSSAHYRVGHPIPAQPMFLRVVSSALGQKHTRHLHSAWLHLFSSALPHMSAALPSNCMRMCSLLCVLLEELPKYYTTEDFSQLKPIPPDYAMTLLSALTTIVHFCLLDPFQSPSAVAPTATSYSSTTLAHPSSLSASALNVSSSGNNPSIANSNSSSQTPGQILFNLLHVFSPVNEVLEASLDTWGQDPLTCARRTLLSHLPRIVAALLSLWTATSNSEGEACGPPSRRHYHHPEQQCLAGSKAAVLQQMVSFLSPVCHHHAPHFVAAISVVWQSLAEDTHENSHTVARSTLCPNSQSASKKASTLQRSRSTNGPLIIKSSSSNSLTKLHMAAKTESARASSFSRSSQGGLQPQLKGGLNSSSLQDVNKAAVDGVGDFVPMERRGSYPENHLLDLTPTCIINNSSSPSATSPLEDSFDNDVEDSTKDPNNPCGDAQRKQHDEKMAAMRRNRECLVRMVAAIRVLPLHMLLDTVRTVLRQPPTVEGFVQSVSVEVSVLEVLGCYVSSSTPNQLGACWSVLLQLLREAVLTLEPRALLLLLPILNDFVQRAQPLHDKKEIRELQDVSGRLIESVSNVAGASLEATTWLRRNLTVKAPRDHAAEWRVSVSALDVLSTEVAPLLDVLYTSDEKDRVLPLLTQLMTHVTPYLRNHTASNQCAFLACSKLVASLSGYQYTLKAWRKDVLDLLLDAHAFRMAPRALSYWCTIVDNMFTHDKTMFKDLLGRVSLSQGGSLHLFSSKESEYEIRSMLLKRLAFAIFCSEPDQYSKYFPDIQERVTEVSRLSEVVPVLVGAVLGVVAVLVVRMAPRALVSLWPAIITEMVQVLLVMEQQLLQDSLMFSEHLKRVSALDSRWVVSSSSSVGLRSHSHPAWLTLYLAACKLLDLLLVLPAHALPQFQMYRWAFVGPPESSRAEDGGDGGVRGGDPSVSVFTGGLRGSSSTTTTGPGGAAAGGIVMKSCEFVPHVVRIARLMAEKKRKDESNHVKKDTGSLVSGSKPVTLNLQPNHLLLSSVSSISTLQDLEPFFTRLANSSPAFPTPCGSSSGGNSSGSSGTTTHANSSNPSSASLFSSKAESMVHVERALERTFLEPLLEQTES